MAWIQGEILICFHNFIIGILVLALICYILLMIPICCLGVMLVRDELLQNHILLLIEWFFGEFVDWWDGYDHIWWWKFGTGLGWAFVMLLIKLIVGIMVSLALLVAWWCLWLIHMFLSLYHELPMMHGLNVVNSWMMPICCLSCTWWSC